MTLRKHQAEVVAACREILDGSPIREIILSVTPGGGKSFVPVILADNLIPAVVEKLCWVVPRNALKYQGEAEFLNARWGTSCRIRAVDGPQELSRGCDGFITTYQAVGQNPEAYAAEFRKHRYILFLDEFHHVAQGSEWHMAFRGMVCNAALVVKASGTLSRGDGEKIAFLQYKANGTPDLSDCSIQRCITYSRSQAIRDGAILRVEFKTVDGTSEWEELDGTRLTSNLSGEESAKALFTALRTEFADQLLEAALQEFMEIGGAYPAAKMLVVAPNIGIAKAYYDYLAREGLFTRIATSADTPAARRNIEDFKRGVYHTLVTVAMAYEGLNVPEVSVICCLTHIRSVPWLEQCFARANRPAPGKPRAVVYAPADWSFKKAVRMIEQEQAVPANADDQLEFGTAGQEPGEGGGEPRPWIIPVGSQAHIDGVRQNSVPAEKLPPCTPSEAEKILRKNIHSAVSEYLDSQRPGARQAQQKILYRRMRTIVNKPVPEMSQAELEKVWLWVREVYGAVKV